MLKVGVPDSKPGEARSGSRFHAVAEIERAIFLVGVRKPTGNGPVGSEQINLALHGTISRGHGFVRHNRFHSLNNLVFIGDDVVFQWFAVGNGGVESRHHSECMQTSDSMFRDLTGDHRSGGRVPRRLIYLLDRTLEFFGRRFRILQGETGEAGQTGRVRANSGG
jgi:hypothetical protein